MTNQIVISRIQHRRGRRENLPQPLRPGEIALTSDTEQVWIGGDPALMPTGLQVYNDKSIATAQSIIDNNIAKITFTAPLAPAAYISLVAHLVASVAITLTEDDIRFNEEEDIVYVGLDTDVDPNNTIVNLDTTVGTSPVSGTVDVTEAVGDEPGREFDLSGFLALESADAASHLAYLVNKLNSATPNEITGLVHTNLNIELGSVTDHTHPYDMSFFVGGTADTINIQIGAFLVPRTVTVSAAAGHLAKCETAANATVTYPIERNGVAVGDATFTSGNTTGTVTISANFTLAAGDILQLYAPSIANTVIQNVVITIVGTALAAV